MSIESLTENDDVAVIEPELDESDDQIEDQDNNEMSSWKITI